MIPVIIPTLCRDEHLKKCIESLLNNVGVELIHLYLFVDYPFEEKHKSGYEKIVNYVENNQFLFKRFGQFSIIYRSYNYGAYSNSIKAIKEVFLSYDRLIFSEDDNIFSPNFIAYMQLCLKKMEFNENVFAINGYLYPVKEPLNCGGNTFLYQGFSAWGCGLWKAKFEKISYDKTNVINFILNLKNVRKVNNHNPLLYRTLLSMLVSDDFYLDAYVDMHLIETNSKCLLPAVSKVKNMGHDGTGVHCVDDSSDIFKTQNIDEKNFFSLNLDENYQANELQRYFSLPLISRMKNYYLWLLTRIKYRKWK